MMNILVNLVMIRLLTSLSETATILLLKICTSEEPLVAKFHAIG